jgi:hypothetical protein
MPGRLAREFGSIESDLSNFHYLAYVTQSISRFPRFAPLKLLLPPVGG